MPPVGSPARHARVHLTSSSPGTASIALAFCGNQSPEARGPMDPDQRETQPDNAWTWQLVITARGASLDHCCPLTDQPVTLEWLLAAAAWGCPVCRTAVSAEAIGAVDPSRSRRSAS
jgi:hypothetical protein